MKFALQEGFTDSYTNTIDYTGAKGLTHPQVLNWKGGKFEPLQIELDLFAGVGDFTTASSALLAKKVLLLFRMSMKQQQKDMIPPRITLTVGTWFERKGIIKSVKANWQAPFDVNTGESLHVKVSFTFEADFANSLTQTGGRQATGLKKLPYGSTYTWKYSGA